MAKQRPSDQQFSGYETDVGLPQAVGERAGGALEPVAEAGADEIDTVHAGGGLEPIPVATPLRQMPPPDFSGDSSSLRPSAPLGPPTEALAAQPRPGGASSSNPTGETRPISERSYVSARSRIWSSRRLTVSASGRVVVTPGSPWRSLLYTAIGLVLVAAVVLAVIYGTRPSPGRQRGIAALADAQQQLDNARNALANRRVADARQAYTATIAALTGEPALGKAVSPPPGDTQALPELAQRAAVLKAEADILPAQIAQAEAGIAVDRNLAALRTRLAGLGDPATDLDALERDLQAYCANPVDPKAAPDGNLAAAYPQQVGEAKLRLPEIPAERNRRRVERVTAPVERVRPVLLDLLQQEHYGEAQARLAEAKAKAPEADFTALAEQVESASTNAWLRAKTYAETRIADWKSPGATAVQRAKAVEDAKRRLNHVIDTFGVPDYEQQAKALLATLP